MKIQNALGSNILDRSQRYFAHVTTVRLSSRVQNIAVVGRIYYTLECFELDPVECFRYLQRDVTWVIPESSLVRFTVLTDSRIRPIVQG